MKPPGLLATRLPAALALAVGLGSAALTPGTPAEQLDTLLADWAGWVAPPAVSEDRRPFIVGIGEETLRELGGWPIPRRHHGELLRRLKAAGATAVAFDILLDRAAPDPRDDLAFRRALDETGAGVLALHLQPVTQMDQEMNLRRSVAVRRPTTALASGAIGAGFVNVTGEAQETGLLRQCRLTWEIDGEILPSLPLTMARLLLPTTESPGGIRRIWYAGSVSSGAMEGAEMSQLLRAPLPEGSLTGRPVLVGAWARELGDVKRTPLGDMPGVEVNANIVINLIQTGFWRSLPPGQTGLLALAVTCISTLALALFSGARCRLLGAFLLGVTGILVAGASLQGVLLGGAAVACLPVLLCLFLPTPGPTDAARTAAVRQLLDDGNTAAARREMETLPAGTLKDSLLVQVLLLEGEPPSAIRLLDGMDTSTLDTETLYRLGRAFEETQEIEKARELMGLVYRHDVNYRDGGARFLDLDRRLVEAATLLGPEQLLAALEATYASVKPLGGGGAGLLFRCREHGASEDVAVKVLDPRLLASGEALARFRREVEVLESLRHPAIVRIRGASFGKICSYSMDLVEGETLAARLATGWQASESECRALLRQAAEGLQCAHDAGVIHRDVKPANLMLRADGGLVIVDFGVARVEDGAQLTQEGRRVGTATYSAPEQLRGGHVDVRVDVYSLGRVIDEVGGAASASWKLRRLVKSMCRQDREERPEDMAAVLRALDQEP